MSLKIESPRPPQVSRPEVKSQVAPSIAKGEPAPSARPSPVADRFERVSASAGNKVPGGSRFEGVGSVRPLPKRLEGSTAVADKVVNFFAKDEKLSALGTSDPGKAREILQASFVAGGLSKRDAKILTQRYAEPQLKDLLKNSPGSTIPGGLKGGQTSSDKAGGSGETPPPTQTLGIRSSGTSRPTDPLGYVSADTQGKASSLIDALDFKDVKSWGDIQKISKDLSDKVELTADESKDALDAYINLKLAERVVLEGIDLGKDVGGKIGPGKDDFDDIKNGGFVPGERLEELPKALEPHRGALEKLTDKLLRDPKLDNDVKLRKALWSELKGLPLQDDRLRHDTRQYLLEELSLRQDRYTE
ncbi:hypothetical protein [Hyalangium sp.]|uniref:hypothetical protein n=1 Tax=Hyalangium sp. TaxID=2028555 RepID=UPI002D493FEB|nr:hypothetical protein [Hyalangium sp.]HYI00009.1 hypothetical protein [Hyalangium sp.]